MDQLDLNVPACPLRRDVRCATIVSLALSLAIKILIVMRIPSPICEPSTLCQDTTYN